MKQLTYTVKGKWPFPLDMLRHDGSAAASDADQAMIDRLSGDFAPDRDAFQDVEITLCGPNKPHTARWESFRWQVPTDTEHARWKKLNQESREREATFRSAMRKLSEAERAEVMSRIGGSRH